MASNEHDDVVGANALKVGVIEVDPTSVSHDRDGYLVAVASGRSSDFARRTWPLTYGEPCASRQEVFEDADRGGSTGR